MKLYRDLVIIGVIAVGVVTLHAGGDEGRIREVLVWEQSQAGSASLADDPYRFIVNIRNLMNSHTGILNIPGGSEPITVVTPSQLVGAHYQYEQGFTSLDALTEIFPNGNYTFDVTRNYGATTTSFSAPVNFTGTKTIPVVAPVIQNTTWNNGVLIVQPAAAKIYYASTSGVGFSWELVGGGGSGGGSGSGAPGMLDLTGSLRFGQTYSGEFRLQVTDDAVTIIDPNAGINDYQKSSTYSTQLESIVRFEIQTPDAPLDFSIQSALYTANGQTWDVKTLLESKVEQNYVIWRMDGGELSSYQAGFYDGMLSIVYTNEEGEFSGEIPYLRNEFNNMLILPNPLHAVPEPASVAMWIGIFAGTYSSLLRRRRKN